MKTGFYLQEGSLYCDEVKVETLLSRGLETPFYLYSLSKLEENFSLYQRAVEGIDATIGYAIKANNNLALCQRLASLGAGAVVVSVDELAHAFRAGFPAEKIWLHGNGKRAKDIDAAIQAGILLSADSLFDLRHINASAQRHHKTANVLLRVNPDIDPGVHPYISTGFKESKFGLSAKEIFSAPLRELSNIKIRGLHCHIGSTVEEVRPFVDAARILLDVSTKLKAQGHPIDTIDLGGGLGIDYQRKSERRLPTPRDLLQPLKTELRGLRLLLEPGRSLVGDTGALISRVIGVKRTEGKSFLVVDASMAQLIRPCLYDAYHQIEPLVPPQKAAETFDVVGPLCESGDFLARERALQAPEEGQGIAILDAGAYGFSMASRYNLHLFCAEYTIEGESLRLTRRAERYEDFASLFTDDPI